MAISVLAVSTILQFVAALAALRLIWVTGFSWAWTLISIGLTVMGLRRTVSLYRAVYDADTLPPDLTAESLALLISVLMVLGVALISPLFRSIRRTNDRLRESEALFRAVVDHSANEISLKDIHGRYLLVNEKFASLANIRPDDILGKTSREIFENNFAESGERHDRIVIEEKAPVVREERFGSGESAKIYSTTKFPVFDTGRNVVAVGAVHADVTPQKQAETALLDAKARAEEASVAKSSFVANMSHELRTPLNSILGFAEMIEAEVHGRVSQPKYKEYAADILASGRHLLSIINDILDLSRVEAGKTPMEDERIGLAACLEICKSIVEAGNRNRRIVSDIPRDLPDLRGDERLIRQIVLNLLSNAVKFTPKSGKISVSAYLESTGGLSVSVADTGRGIADEERVAVTEPFYQVSAGPHYSQAGIGLGLALAKAFMSLHDGTLEIDSTMEQGTTVTMRFPAGRVLQAPSA